MDAKRKTPDGDPIPMSEFTLGERYGSEDMYRGMGIEPAVPDLLWRPPEGGPSSPLVIEIREGK